MIREGDLVAPFFNMGRRGVVVEINEVPGSTHMVGGTSGRVRLATIRLEDSKELMVYRISELMPVQ